MEPAHIEADLDIFLAEQNIYNLILVSYYYAYTLED
jgi:hypothetical protein